MPKRRSRTRGIDGDVLWSFSCGSDEPRRIYFRNCEEGTWHTLQWQLKKAQAVPVSTEALEYAKRVALELADVKRPYVDAATAKLLADWGTVRDLTPTERRVGARPAAQLAENRQGDEDAKSVRTVKRMLGTVASEWPDELEAPPPAVPKGGDDDDDDDLLSAFVFGDDELMGMM